LEKEVNAMSLTTNETTSSKITSFVSQYGDEAIEFACHAAFPLALTTELCYCLREKFAPAADWWIAPELLLSGLCKQVKFDLYAMNPDVRIELLAELVEMYGEERLDEVARYMGEYLTTAIDQNFRLQAISSDPELVKYFVLCLLRPNDFWTGEIKRRLSQMLQQVKDDPQQRFELARLVEKQVDFLAQHGFEPVSLRELELMPQAIADNTLDELDRIKQSMATAGFPGLASKLFDYAKIELKENAIATGDAFGEFSFETVTVNDRGKVVDQQNLTAKFFQEPVAAGLEMVAIPSGRFMMGSPASEHERYDDEGSQHEVMVAPFFIGKYPVTQAQWRSIANTPAIEQELNPDPSDFKGDNLPVENVRWEQAQEFCARLSRETGRSYRLPTEAEWEYACRAGTTTPFHFGETISGKLANYNSDVIYRKEAKVKQRGQTSPVGEFAPNAFGLYDMHGNVWEWCQDDWHNNYEDAPSDGSAWTTRDFNGNKILRGGSWINSPRNCRSAIRSDLNPANRINDVGFRVVCEMPRT
jgi:formylglycine-generating enzyme required for sulfatase activity